jgi:hypothetical protein
MRTVRLEEPIRRLAASSRRAGITPSLFIDGFYVNRIERTFEMWLYSQGFRPSWDNFLGKTVVFNGLDVQIVNRFYPTLKTISNLKEADIDGQWRQILYFATLVTQVKKLVTE